MVLIKILSLLLLLPSLYSIRKLIEKKELNFFDFLLLFSSLYFAIIPLKSNQEVFDSIGLITRDNSLFVFYYLLFYFLLLAFLSTQIKENNKTAINITQFLKNYPDINASLILKILLIVLPIFSITYYVPQMSIISAFSEIRDANSDASYEQSSMVKYFGTIFKLGLIITLKLFFQKKQGKKVDVLILTSLLLFLVNLVMLPRRELLVFCLFGALLFYSSKRDAINKKFIIIIACFGIFLYTVYFPFYNIIRFSPVQFDLKNPTESISEIYNFGISSYDNSKEGASELTDTRAIGLYRAVYWLAKYDTNEDISWGGITLAAIDHAIPKAINPGKGLGSETILEKRMHAPNDSADSILLLALADYSIFGNLYTILLYILIYYLLLVIARKSETLFGQNIISYYLIFFIFRLTFDVEQKLDAILANIVSFILVIILIVAIQKLNIISLSEHPEIKTS
ncbi:hypothetical protein [Cellulophaga baltica]|uniref:hypothetical protein n=1 Tax=Cellulophaga baltica TaxID=76594 RepID=UPI0015F4E15B|nr:hypothetical protein [Cellulophaga baltica]MBA6315440.1 hypothetical protein [Cellulophaga baltica]